MNRLPHVVEPQSVSPLEVDVMTFAEFWLALLVVLVGVIALRMQHASLRQSGQTAASDYTKSTILVVVIVAAMLTVVAGFTSKDIAPMMGLLGTVVGYVVGNRGATRS